MPPLAAAAPAIGAVVGAGTSILGGITAANGAAAQGANAEALGQYEAEQYQQEGETSVARAQRKMLDQQRQNKLVASSQLARGAAGGTDPSMGSTNILMQQTQGRGTYAALSDLAAGEDQQSGFENQAAAAEYQGNLARSLVPEEQVGAYAGAASSAFGTLGRAAAGGSFGTFG